MPDKLPYAGTKVSPERTQGEIFALIRKYKGVEVSYSERGNNEFSIGFMMSGLKYRFIQTIPPSDAPRRWRVLYWLLKGDLEAIATGIVRIEERWFPNIVDPASDRTMWEIVSPQLLEYKKQLALPAGKG